MMTLPHSITPFELFGVITAGALLTLLVSNLIDIGLRVARRLGYLP